MMIYKNFGLLYSSDQVLTIIGCISVLIFGFGRSFWVTVSAAIGYKSVMSLTLLIQALITLLIAYIPQ